MDSEKHAVVLIPAYKPDERMVSLCAELRGAGLTVFVVDDGGGLTYAGYFDAAEKMGCHVYRHAVNLGKGRALKTGINAAMNHYGDRLLGIVTADADGQHSCADILQVTAALQKHPGSLIMGIRSFTGKVPFKSRAGNAITRHMYRFVTGIQCHDTQTGLRGLPGSSLGEMLSLRGERYEYEMTLLMHLRNLDIPLVEIPIQTIYFNDNDGSHFHPFRDAVRIYSVIFYFMLSSVLSFGLDYSLYLLGMFWLALAPVWSYALARVLSSLFNYWLNRKTVFGNRGSSYSVVRYYMLAAVILAAGSGLVEMFSSMGFGAVWIKIPVDIVLFFVSYVVQRDFVFGKLRRSEKKPQKKAA